MIYAYLGAAIFVLLAIGAAGVKGHSIGKAEVRAEWAEATAKAKEASDAQADKERQNARKAASTLQNSLSKERTLKIGLNNALQAHIRAAKPIPAGCPAPELDSVMFDLWQRSNAGPEGDPGRSLPPAGGIPASPEKP